MEIILHYLWKKRKISNHQPLHLSKFFLPPIEGSNIILDDQQGNYDMLFRKTIQIKNGNNMIMNINYRCLLDIKEFVSGSHKKYIFFG